MADTNKVKFGLKSCYYSVISEDASGQVTYGTPVSFPGAVSLSLDIEGGDPEPFYADDIVYYQSPATNGGYSGDFEVAKVTDDFRTAILGDVIDSKGVLMEDADAVPKSFALMCQFSGDKHNTRHVFYNCTATRPSAGSQTIEDSREPQTESITITAVPQTFGTRHIVKGKATPDSDAYDGWFGEVVTPAFTGA